MNFHLLAPYFKQEILDEVPDLPWLTKVRLDQLIIDPPELQDNRLAESRLFLAHPVFPSSAEYVGVLNARAHKKYAYRKFDWQLLSELIPSKLAPDRVLAFWPTIYGAPFPNADWLTFTELVCDGMATILCEMCDHFAIPIEARFRPSVWANDFVFHRSIWPDFIGFWSDCFWYLFDKYGFDPPFTYSDDPSEVRKIAYLLERVTTLFVAQRLDLECISVWNETTTSTSSLSTTSLKY